MKPTSNQDWLELYMFRSLCESAYATLDYLMAYAQEDEAKHLYNAKVSIGAILARYDAQIQTQNKKPFAAN